MSNDDWLITMKPTFLTQLTALPPKESAQVQKKLELLANDPTPDAKVKKKLKYMDGALHRLRSGNFRIFYTFESPYISVLTLVRRDDDTYDEELPAEFLGGLNPDLKTKPKDDWSKWITEPKKAKKTKLPAAITEELLENLHVPGVYHDVLMAITTEEDLLEVEGVPDEVLLQVHEAVVEKPLDELLLQPDLVAPGADDLLRYKKGELLGFLLKLTPVQQKFVDWAKNAKGPTLLKGGPGTGKSTVAIYRARTMLEVLRGKGVEEPRLLFTTYTKALIEFTRQLLRSLLGADEKYIEVRTADSVARQVASRFVSGKKPLSFKEQRTFIKDAIQSANYSGNALEVKAQKLALERLGVNYLVEEVTGVIQARGLESLDDYLKAPRPGRKKRLKKTQRRAVWALALRFAELLRQKQRYTWPQVRANAARIVAQGGGGNAYDGVIVDEAQDLDPSAIRMLVGLCKEPGGLFLTADANQSIYGAGFRWKHVHESLKFAGRTSVLKANHRSTRELGEAAFSYLGMGMLDDEDGEREYVHDGLLPAVRAVESESDEVALLARFLPAAARGCSLTLGACAVLTASSDEGTRIAEDLNERGVEATFMKSSDLDLKKPGVKVLPLQAAKGLEFPVVAIAGFSSNAFNYLRFLDGDDLEEGLLKERRTMFVAMTRAMRALLVVLPFDTDQLGPARPLVDGFDPELWNMGDEA